MPELDPKMVARALAGEGPTPLLYPSGLLKPHKGVRPTVPIDLENSEPGAAAAYRMQQAVKPDFGRPGEGPTVPQVLMGAAPIGRLAAGGTQLMSRALAAAPLTATGVGAGTAFGLGTSKAGETDQDEARPSRGQEAEAALNKLNTELGPQRTQLDKLKARFAGKQLSQQDYDLRRTPLEGKIGRLEAQIKEADAPYQRQLQAWEVRNNASATARQEAADKLLIDRQKAGQPFRVKHPDATNAIITGGNALSGTTALLTGLLSRGKVKPTLGAMGVGGLEGAVTSNIPEWLDLGGFQPVGGPEWQKTLAQQTSPENMIKSLAEGAVHATGAGGISYGSSFIPKIASRIKGLPGTPGPTGPLPPTPTTPVLAPQVPLATPEAAPLVPFSSKSPAIRYSEKSGLWHYAPGSGKTGTVPKVLWPQGAKKAIKAPKETAASEAAKKASPLEDLPDM